MAFLLSSEVFFALLKPAPEEHPVIAWKRGVRNEQVFASVISVGELVDAITRLSSGVHRQQWEVRLREHLPHAFHGRILPIDQRTAEDWGTIRGMHVNGDPLASEEALILASARVNGYSLVTRQASYHRRLGVSVVDPFARDAS